MATGGSSDLRIELNVFNLFNRTHPGNPIADLSSPFFGQITQTRGSTNPRQVQLGVKWTF